MNTHFLTVDKTELDDFKASCQQLKVDPDSFQLEEHDVTQTPAGYGVYNGKLTISRNGKSKTYITGNGSKWPAEFDNDLKADMFN